jgi:hypothetical protein
MVYKTFINVVVVVLDVLVGGFFFGGCLL